MALSLGGSAWGPQRALRGCSWPWGPRGFGDAAFVGVLIVCWGVLSCGVGVGLWGAMWGWFGDILGKIIAWNSSCECSTSLPHPPVTTPGR